MTPLIAVHDFRRIFAQSDLAGIQDKVNLQAVADAPGQDIAGIPVDNGHQIQPVGADGDVCNVDRPDMIGMGNVQAFQQVGVNWILWIGLARILPRINRLNPHFPHMPIYRFMIDGQALFLAQPDAYPTITELRMRRVNLVNQSLNVQIFL